MGNLSPAKKNLHKVKPKHLDQKRTQLVILKSSLVRNETIG